jgi:hypothetical protein
MFREPSFVAFVVGFADVKSKPMSSLKENLTLAVVQTQT